MKKRILYPLLLLVLMIGLFSVSARAAELDDGLVYEVYEEYVEITDYVGNSEDVVIPAEIEGKPVTSIADKAFYLGSFHTVEIPDSVRFIGDEAFALCYGLRSVVIPDSVINIGYRLFDRCQGLTSAVIGNNVQFIGDEAFYGCYRLTSVVIGNSVSYIGEKAFEGCDSLTSVVIPDSVRSIRYKAFVGCVGLTSVVIGNDVVSIGSLAFSGCSNLSTLEFGRKINTIDVSAFFDCDSLTSVVIPNSVTTIGSLAFSGCDNLTDVAIPAGVSYIDSSAFSNCTSLRLINVDPNNPMYHSDAFGVLFDKQKTQLMQAPGALAGSYVIPNSVTDITPSAFSNCVNLTDVVIGSGVISIGNSAFSDCDKLSKVVISDSVTTIENSAFSRCDNLNKVVFKGNAPLFGANIFWDVTTTVYYPTDNATWTANVMQDYSGSITWVPYNPDNPFLDVPLGAFYEAPVLWALENNITTGATADTFNPNGKCLRAQVVTFLHRAAGNPEPTADSNPFTDVKTSDFFYKPVLWAVEKGITNGVSATEFGSYAVCNRAAVVTFLWRAAGSPEPAATDNPFIDVKDTDFFYKPVLWAIENGITNGISATEFGPTADCNRAQVVTFLYRAYN